MLTKPAALDGGYMEGDIKSFTDTATKLSRSPLGIIALFVVLVYGIAALAPALYASSLGDAEKLLLVIFIVAFPVIILGVFAWLVTAHNDKVYAPTEFLTLEDYLKFLEARSKLDAEKAAKTAASLSIATLKSSAGGQELQGSDIDQIVDVAVQAALPSVMKEDTDWHDHILWVDDRPQANAHERRAFEAMGIRFSRVTNTQEALELLHRHKFVAIISDMGRAEGEHEGLVLIDAVREFNSDVPIFIYSTPKSEDFIAECERRGAQAVVSDPRDLFKAVLGAVADAKSKTLKMSPA